VGDIYKVMRGIRLDKLATQGKAHNLDMRCGYLDCGTCYPPEEDGEPKEVVIPED
jgi:hypothetical protein